MTNRVGLKFLAVVASLYLLQSPEAQARSTRQTRERQAHKDCLGEDFQAGIDILVDLFLQTKDPTYLYNEARCYQQNHRYDQAIDRFQEYLRVATKITPEVKAEVDHHIADCQQMRSERGQQDAGTPASAPSVATLAGPTPEPPVASAADSGEAVLSTAAPAQVEPSSVVPAATPAGLDVRAKQEPSPSDAAGTGRPSFYRTWWFWTGAAAVVVAGTLTALLIAGHTNGPCDGASLACQGVK